MATDLALNCSDLCKTWQINECKTKNMWRVDLQIYGLPVNSLVVSCDSGRFIFNLPLHILKFREPSVGQVMELCPFGLRGHCVCCMGFPGLVIAGNIDELKNQRSSSDDTATSR